MFNILLAYFTYYDASVYSRLLGYLRFCESTSIDNQQEFFVYELDLGFNFPVKVFELYVYCKDIYLQPCHWCLIYIHCLTLAVRVLLNLLLKTTEAMLLLYYYKFMNMYWTTVDIHLVQTCQS